MSEHRVVVRGKFLHVDGQPWLLKGLAYGPFDGPDGLPSPDQVASDLQQVLAMGCNTLRVYVPPPRWFMEACAAAGVRVLVGWPWASHTDFLRTRRGARQIVEQARAVVRAVRGMPAVLGFCVGNEVPAEWVRWMGVDRVRRFLERLIDSCRREAPGHLFVYASFPSTEYLNPRNADLVVCNIYLEDRAAFTRYLARLQLVAGDRPLVIGEFGLDTHRHGPSRQADAVAWAWGAAMRTGVAGLVVFSFSDDWFNHGRPMESEWAFGVTTGARQPKEASTALAALLTPLRCAGDGIRLRSLPRFSVIICSYNGSGTLRQALESVQALNYPDYEIILVDDGSSDPAVAAMAAEYREIRTFHIAHGGLSRARNFGATRASGSILVFLDDDAAAERDWLMFLALAFEDERVGAAGGPNIPPPPPSWRAAAIAAAPGGPATVMLNDTEAEHVPGCNLAVTRTAWETIGGFDERHHTAGDDVDFCWRLLDHGYTIAYEPGAMVWHWRRQSVQGYFRQQIGYGRAEATLIAQHPHRFDRLGGARWRGAIYEPTAQAAAGDGFIYAGIFGTAPYQFMYARTRVGGVALATGAPWVMTGLGFMVAGFWHPAWAAPGLILLGVTIWMATRLAAAVPLARWPRQNALSVLAARTLVATLTLAQPVVRGLARALGCLHHRTLPRGRWQPTLPHLSLRWHRRKAVAQLAFWHEDGLDRIHLLGRIIEALRQTPSPAVPGHEWADWDFEMHPGPWWSVRVVTATEYHPPPGRLTRLQIQTRARPATLCLAAGSTLTVLTLLAFDPGWGLWALAFTFLLWLALEHVHTTTTTRLAQLVLESARQLGWQVLQHPEGNSSGGHPAGVYNVNTSDRSNHLPP